MEIHWRILHRFLCIWLFPSRFRADPIFLSHIIYLFFFCPHISKLFSNKTAEEVENDEILHMTNISKSKAQLTKYNAMSGWQRSTSVMVTKTRVQRMPGNRLTYWENVLTCEFSASSCWRGQIADAWTILHIEIFFAIERDGCFCPKNTNHASFWRVSSEWKEKERKTKTVKVRIHIKKTFISRKYFLGFGSCSIIFTWRWTIQSLLHGPTTDMGMLQLPFDIFVRMNVVQVLFFGHYFHSFFYLRSHNWLISCYKLQNARETTFKCHHV